MINKILELASVILIDCDLQSMSEAAKFRQL